MQQMRETERGLAGGAGEHHAARAVEFILGQKIVDQKRQHEQRPQQRLIIALAAGESRIAADARIGVVDRRHALAMRGGVAQAALADVGGFDHQMRRHRKIAEQAFAFGDARMARGDHVAKSPHRNVAETFGRRKQLPVFQLVAEHGVGDVVGGEREAIDLDQQRVVGQCGGIGQLASRSILHCCRSLRATMKSVDFIFSIPAFFAAVIFAFADVCFATSNLV